MNALVRCRRLPYRLLFALLGVVVLGTACEIRTEINLTVDDDGSGEVLVAVGLDEEAAARLESLGGAPDVSDLTATGWVVTGPVAEGDTTWIRARHPFASPDQVGPLVEQIAGTDGPFRDFDVQRIDEFAESRWEFTGVVDFSGGTEPLRDDELDDALAVEGLGDALTVIGDQLDAVVDDTLVFQVAVRLPGEVTSNAPTAAANGAVWNPSLTERTVLQLQATGTIERTDRIIWRWVAIAAGFAMVLFLVVRLALFVRRRSDRP